MTHAFLRGFTGCGAVRRNEIMCPSQETTIATQAANDHAALGPPNFGVSRRRDERVVAGLAGGIADALGIDAAYVRAAFVALLTAGGLGALLYAIGWMLTAHHVVDGPSEPIVASSASERNRTVGAGIAFAGVLLALSETSLWLGSSSGAVTLTAFGLATLWARSDRAQRTRWTNALLGGEDSERSRRELGLRAVAGGLLIAVGLTLFFTTSDALRPAGSVVLAALISGVGLLLVFGPWVFRLSADLRNERLERVRSEEREELAAHLHDSVLQTLALIQRSKDPAEQAILARIQERELRSWLFGSGTTNGGTLARAIEQAAATVERDHQVAVELVTVGDCELDYKIDALVGATREAMVNAAKHSGARSVSVYLEVSESEVDVFVTDQGIGFDPESVAEDRYGISDSMVGRMSRHGGHVEIESQPGEGTEVHITITRSTR